VVAWPLKTAEVGDLIAMSFRDALNQAMETRATELIGHSAGRDLARCFANWNRRSKSFKTAVLSGIRER